MPAANPSHRKKPPKAAKGKPLPHPDFGHPWGTYLDSLTALLARTSYALWCKPPSPRHGTLVNAAETHPSSRNSFLLPTLMSTCLWTWSHVLYQVHRTDKEVGVHFKHKAPSVCARMCNINTKLAGQILSRHWLSPAWSKADLRLLRVQAVAVEVVFVKSMKYSGSTTT